MKSGIFIDYTFGELPRFVTTFIETTTLGSFLAFVLLFAVFGKNIINIRPVWIKHLLNLMVLLCIFLTFSKGAITILFIASAFILNFNKKISKLIRKVYFYSAFMIIGLVICYIMLFSSSGASAHITGLKTGLLSAFTHPFGLGLGNAGNFANLLEDGGEIVGGESAVGSMLGQLGFAGFIPYLIFIVSLVKTFVKYIRCSQLFIVIAGAFLGYCVNSLFTDSALGVTGNFYYFLFAGLLTAQVISFKSIKKEVQNEKNIIYNT